MNYTVKKYFSKKKFTSSWKKFYIVNLVNKKNWKLIEFYYTIGKKII